jgi:hypothetical protein
MTEEALCSFARRFGGVICDLIGDTLVTSTQLVDFRRYHSGQNDGDRELVTDFVRLLVRTGISLQRAKAERSYEDATVAKVGTSIGLGNSRLVDVGGRFIELESHDGTRIDSGTENKLEEHSVTRRTTPARS